MFSPCFNYFIVISLFGFGCLNPDHQPTTQRKLPSPGFMVEVVLVDYDGTVPAKVTSEGANKKPDDSPSVATAAGDKVQSPNTSKESGNTDDVFSDCEAEESGSSKHRQVPVASSAGPASTTSANHKGSSTTEEVSVVTHGAEQISLSDGTKETPASSKPQTVGNGASKGEAPKSKPEEVSEFKAIAADASVFTFGDEDDEESD